MICGDLTLQQQNDARKAEAANRVHYCSQCGHNSPDERCSDPVVPPQHQREYQAIHRAALAASSAICTMAYIGYPAPFIVDADDIQAIEAFITERLRAKIV